MGLNPMWLLDFNPRPLAGATTGKVNKELFLIISIHAPIRGRRRCTDSRRESTDFNPRPHTGATTLSFIFCTTRKFQSTPPYGGDRCDRPGDPAAGISIHAPIRGRPDTGVMLVSENPFQSTPPYGGDRRLFVCPADFVISIHAPIRGRQPVLEFLGPDTEFQSTPPYGGDTYLIMLHFRYPYFNPRPHTGATKHHFQNFR